MNKFAFAEFITENKKLVDKRIVQYVNLKSDLFNRLPLFGSDLSTRLVSFATRGKNIRGVLFLFTAEMFGEKICPALIDIAAGLELIHSSLLIHDDVMDNDLLRRGQPSLYSQYLERMKKSSIKENVQTAKSLAICVGDLSFFLGMQLINRAVFDLKLNDSILTKITDEIMLVGLAQMEDVFYGNQDETPSLKEIDLVYLYKTARYTFSLPMSLSTLVAKQKSDMIVDIEQLGEHIGFIFQLRDDEIGLFMDEGISGKTKGSDIRENKKTYLKSLLYSHLSISSKTKLDSIFGNKNITENDIKYIQNIIITSGVTKQIQNIVEDREKKAIEIINRLPVKHSYKASLVGLLRYISDRKK